MNTFDHIEYRFYLLIIIIIYLFFFFFAFPRRRLLWKLVTSAVQNRQTHTCAAII